MATKWDKSGVMFEFEELPDQCDNCGAMDDLCDIERIMSHRIDYGDGQTSYVCLKCASTVYDIKEATEMIERGW